MLSLISCTTRSVCSHGNTLRGCPHLELGNQCTWVQVQNGVVFTPWVTDMWSPVFIVIPFCPAKHHSETGMKLATNAKQWTAAELTKTMCTQGPSVHFFPRVHWRSRNVPEFLGGYLTKEKGVFTLVPIEYRTQVPCPNTKCERCLTCSGLLLQKVLYHYQNFHSIWYFFYIKEGHEKEYSWVKHEKFTRSRFRLTAVLFVISRHCSLFLST